MPRDAACMDFTTIEVDSDGAVAHVTLNRPEKLNPLSTTTLLELAAAAESARLRVRGQRRRRGRQRARVQRRR